MQVWLFTLLLEDLDAIVCIKSELASKGFVVTLVVYRGLFLVGMSFDQGGLTTG